MADGLPVVPMASVNVPRFDTVGAGAQQYVNADAVSRLAPQAPQPMNPLQAMQMGEVAAQTRNAQNQNMLFQKEMQAKQVFGQIIQKFYDPQTKTFDFSGAVQAAATNPVTGPFAADLIQAYAQTGNIQAEAELKKLSAKQQMLGSISNVLAPRLAEGNSVTKDEMFQDVYSLRAQGIIDAQEGLAIMTQIQGLDKGEDRARFIKNIYTQTHSVDDATKMVLGEFVEVNGLPYRRNVMTGQLVPLGHIVTSADQAQREGAPIGTPMLNAPGQVPTPTPDTTGQEIGGVPNAQNPPKQLGGQATVPPPQGNGPVPLGLAPQQAQVQEAGGKDFADYRKTLNDQASAANRNLQDINMAEQTLDQFRSGGGAKMWGSIAQIGQAFGVRQDLLDSLVGGGLNAQQVYSKLMFDVGVNQLRQNFAGSGQIKILEYMQQMENLPNIEMDPRAAKELFEYLRTRSNLTIAEQRNAEAQYHEYQRGRIQLEDIKPEWDRRVNKSGFVMNGDDPGLLALAKKAFHPPPGVALPPLPKTQEQAPQAQEGGQQ